jgi:Protein of unknown function (DUF4239)
VAPLPDTAAKHRGSPAVIYTGTINGPLIVGGGVVLSLLLVILVRSRFSAEQLTRAHEATGNMLAVVGTLYAVMLGLVVVDAMVRFEKAIDVVQSESACLADIYILSQRLPETHRQRLHDACRAYAVAVVEKEWPLMAQGFVSADARKAGLRVLRSLDDFEPTTEAEKAAFPLILEEMQNTWDRRRERISTAEYGIPAVEWVALLLGAVVTVVFAGLFHVENFRLQMLITAMAALVIGLNLYLVSLFGYPYAGDLTVSNRPFRVDIGVFDGLFDDGPAHDGERASAAAR